MFGIQISNHGWITNYSEANIHYNNIVLNENNDWSYYESKYKKLINNLCTEFRKTTETEWLKYCKEKQENEKNNSVAGSSC